MNTLLKAKWEKGKNNTLHFYTKKLPWKNAALNRELYLPDFFAPWIGKKKNITIAELGAGMFCTIGSKWKTANVRVYASDALADEFNQILEDKGITAVVPLEKQDMENLTYKKDFFDIVYCCNALDHCTNPLKAIKEMYRVLKPGGHLYLQHVINVGVHERYAGLHMWNIDFDDKNHDCVIWNQNKRISLESYIPGFKNTVSDESKVWQITSILHKK